MRRHFRLISWPFCLNSSLFCIYFSLLLPLFSFSFPFLSLHPISSFSFTFPPIFSFPFHIFPPNDISWYFPPGGGLFSNIYSRPLYPGGLLIFYLSQVSKALYTLSRISIPDIQQRVLSLCNMYLKYQLDERAVTVFPENSGFFLVVRNCLTEKSSVFLSVIRQFYSCNLSGDVWVHIHTYTYIYICMCVYLHV